MRDPVLASRVFGVYLAAAGMGLAVVPGVLLPLLGLPAPTEAWIRVVGILTAILGMYFLYCAAPDQQRFFKATVIARLMFFTGIATLVVSGIASPILLLFGLVDLLGAAWTLFALRATRATNG